MSHTVIFRAPVAMPTEKKKKKKREKKGKKDAPAAPVASPLAEAMQSLGEVFQFVEMCQVGRPSLQPRAGEQFNENCTGLAQIARLGPTL